MNRAPKPETKKDTNILFEGFSDKELSQLRKKLGSSILLTSEEHSHIIAAINRNYLKNSPQHKRETTIANNSFSAKTAPAQRILNALNKFLKDTKKKVN